MREDDAFRHAILQGLIDLETGREMTLEEVKKRLGLLPSAKQQKQ